MDPAREAGIDRRELDRYERIEKALISGNRFDENRFRLGKRLQKWLRQEDVLHEVSLLDTGDDCGDRELIFCDILQLHRKDGVTVAPFAPQSNES